MFLAQVAAQTARIRLGTGIVTLPLELPIRVAEDAAVLDLMCGGISRKADALFRRPANHLGRAAHRKTDAVG